MPESRAHVRKPRGIFEERPNVFLAQALMRTWYILLPLIGIWAAGVRFIKPNLTQIRNEGTLQRLKNEQQGRQLLNQMNASEAVIKAAQFERDSVLTPAIERRLFLVDSSRAIVAGERAEVEDLLAKVDSLDDATQRLERRMAALAETVDAVAAEQARLDSVRTFMTDSLTRLRARAAETWSRARERE